MSTKLLRSDRGSFSFTKKEKCAILNAHFKHLNTYLFQKTFRRAISMFESISKKTGVDAYGENLLFYLLITQKT